MASDEIHAMLELRQLQHYVKAALVVRDEGWGRELQHHTWLATPEPP